MAKKLKRPPVSIRYHGHSNVEIISGDHVIQIDPFYTSNPLADIKAADVTPTHILLSHAHFDHTEDAEALSKRTGAPIASNYEITTWYEKKGCPTQPMNHGGGWDFPFGRVTLTLAFHTSSFADGTYGGQPAGLIVQTAGVTIYHAGDTALFSDMKLIGKLWDIDLACLPIGDCFTMGPDHAILAAEMLGARRVLPIHYNTFPQIKQDAEAFSRQLKKRAGIKGVPLKTGESLEL
jgi:L-ascorbate metabolism protein UlaG (beta-lactamase superfamily)